MFGYGKLWPLLYSCCECGALKKKEQTQKKKKNYENLPSKTKF
jgi:hypothetical protein